MSHEHPTTAVDASFSELVSPLRLAPVNLRQTAHAIGETLGVVIGGSGYLWAAAHGGTDLYWWLTGAAVLAVSLFFVSRREPVPRGATV